MGKVTSHHRLPTLTPDDWESHPLWGVKQGTKKYYKNIWNRKRVESHKSTWWKVSSALLKRENIHTQKKVTVLSLLSSCSLRLRLSQWYAKLQKRFLFHGGIIILSTNQPKQPFTQHFYGWTHSKPLDQVYRPQDLLHWTRKGRMASNVKIKLLVTEYCFYRRLNSVKRASF